VRPLINRSARITKLLISFLFVSSSLFAQAWLSPKGEGTLSLGYQHNYVRDHAFSGGERLDAGHIHAHAANLDVDYSLTDRLALTVGLPYIAAKYSGLKPHQLPIDGGTYHGTFQDFRVDLRYNISTRPVVITPFFEAIIPSHSYVYFAHSAIGTDLREYHLGTNLGRRLDPVLSNAYFQARYSYVFVERTVGIAPNRSDTELQFGYFLNPRVSLLGLGSWHLTHSGIAYTYKVFPADLTPEQFRHHDQIGKSNIFDVGAGAAFSLSPSLDMSVSLMHTLRARNGHAHAAVVSAGFSWSFRTRLAAASPSSVVPQSEAAAAVESAHSIGEFNPMRKATQ
jgi:hypothetical protein